MLHEQIVLICDAHGGDCKGEVHHSVNLGWGGKTYALDFCEKGLSALEKAILPVIENATITNIDKSAPKKRKRATGPDYNRDEVRAFAEKHGMTVPERGRIAKHVLEAFRAHQNGQDVKPAADEKTEAEALEELESGAGEVEFSAK